MESTHACKEIHEVEHERNLGCCTDNAWMPPRSVLVV